MTEEKLPAETPAPPGHRCSRQVFGRDDPLGGSQCSRKATVACEGKHFCRQHSPAEIERKRAEWHAEYDHQSAERKVAWKLEELARAAGFSGLTEAELEVVIGMGGIRAVIAKAAGA